MFDFWVQSCGLSGMASFLWCEIQDVLLSVLLSMAACRKQTDFPAYHCYKPPSKDFFYTSSLKRVCNSHSSSCFEPTELQLGYGEEEDASCEAAIRKLIRQSTIFSWLCHSPQSLLLIFTPFGTRSSWDWWWNNTAMQVNRTPACGYSQS